MTIEELRAWCLEHPGAEETFPFNPDTSVFKVGGKVFAISRLDDEPLRVSIKCEPELGAQLRIDYDAVLPAYHLNKRHWITLVVDGSLEDGMARDLVEDSYDLVVSALPARVRATLAAG
jgi:predicted DNA-binding protein (MmcQ/YjbR family)